MKVLSTDPALSAADLELERLIQSVGVRCRTAFTELYKLTSPRLFGLILRVNKIRSEAEEVLQDTYLAIWNRSSQYNPQKGRAINWLLAIAHNLAISSLRKRAVRPQAEPKFVNDEGDAYASLPSAETLPVDTLIRCQADEAVRDSLDQLNAEHRQCLTLAFFDGMSHRQIAEHLNRPVGTVKSWLRRTLLTLQPMLREHR
jgi:RNA polymerase sigma-70 factor, ECF subfamily